MSVCYCCKKSVREDERVSGLHKNCFCKWFSLQDPKEFSDIVARSGETSQEKLEWSHINTSFFHGKFRKYSARMGNRSYILKVVQDDFPELPSTEYLCNQLAIALGLEVPAHFLILFQNELVTFVTSNFMDQHPGCDLVHIYRYLSDPSHYACEHLLKIIESEIGRYDAIVRFIELCLFDSLIGNHDRHGRNIGIIRGPSGSLLAPFYDNPCYLAMEIPQLLGANHQPRGAISTLESKEPLMKDYVLEWQRLGFKSEVVNFTHRIDLKKLEALVRGSFVSTQRQDAILRLILKRYKELVDAL